MKKVVKKAQSGANTKAKPKYDYSEYKKGFDSGRTGGKNTSTSTSEKAGYSEGQRYKTPTKKSKSGSIIKKKK